MRFGDDIEQDGDAPIEYLIGIRLRDPASAEDYKLVGFDVHVGEFVLVETANGSAVGEGRRPKRPVPALKKDPPHRRVPPPATEGETRRRPGAPHGGRAGSSASAARAAQQRLVDV